MIANITLTPDDILGVKRASTSAGVLHGLSQFYSHDTNIGMFATPDQLRGLAEHFASLAADLEAEIGAES